MTHVWMCYMQTHMYPAMMTKMLILTPHTSLTYSLEFGFTFHLGHYPIIENKINTWIYWYLFISTYLRVIWCSQSPFCTKKFIEGAVQLITYGVGAKEK